MLRLNCNFRGALSKAMPLFTRHTISAVSAANECEEIILRQQNNEER